MAMWTKCPSYEIDLDAPPAKRFAVIDDVMMDRSRRLLASLREGIPARALSLAPMFNARTRWRFSAELKAIGEYAGIDWRWLMLANVSYDLALSYLGCSIVVMPTPDGPVVARNMDWAPQDLLAQASCELRYVRGGQFQFAIAGWPGSVGVVTGISAKGYALALNAALAEEGSRKTGYPVLLFLRRVLAEADGFDAAVAMVRDQKLFTCGLITLAGTSNDQRVCIERTPSRAQLRWGEPDRPLVTTNSYRLFDDDGWEKPLRPDGSDLFATACSRYERLDALATEMLAAGKVSPDDLLGALCDPGVIQEITAQHVIMHPARTAMDLYAPTHLLEA